MEKRIEELEKKVGDLEKQLAETIQATFYYKDLHQKAINDMRLCAGSSSRKVAANVKYV
ncbi:hypothetical protein ABLB90_19400 [Photorhabdus bodei]|uniref:Uncharacterized protein n=1 Tax=Photorhabdus kayaii TaxID=230088 RepID=A0ABX0B451_9GAMM|nr:MULTISPECIES: hypothetical protein [Photorhabdus]MCC8375775.1 hypothetical protein [Photorhabdus bodei]NDL14354.1 hypothetical protein [Photorhabdus kayaii]NDL27871.1 hypothetical protein [Photorhabdus kayaii]